MELDDRVSKAGRLLRLLFEAIKFDLDSLVKKDVEDIVSVLKLASRSNRHAIAQVNYYITKNKKSLVKNKQLWNKLEQVKRLLVG